MAIRAYYEVANWHSVVDSGATKTITGVAYTSGDRVVVWGTTEDVGHTITLANATGLTFSAVAAGTFGTGSLECGVWLWEGVASSTQSGITLTFTKNANASSGIVGGCAWVNTGDGGAVANVSVDRNESAPANITPTAGSVVVLATADWNATGTKAGTTGTGTLTEREDSTSGGYAIVVEEWSGVTASSTQFALSNYTSMKNTQTRFELKAAAGGDVNGSAASSLTFGAAAAGVATGMSYGSAGSGSAASGASPMTVATTTTLNVGDLFHVVMAYDNSGGSGADPVTGQLTASPASGAFGTVLAQQSSLNDPGAASGGLAIRNALYAVTTQVPSGTNISLAWSGTVVVRSVTFTRIWTSTPNATLGYVSAAGTFTTTSQVATGTPAWTTNSVTADDFLLCFGGHEWGSVVPTGDSDTTNGTWLTAHGQNNGTNSAAGMSTVVQAKRVTATATQTWNPTGTSSDWILGGVIIRETVLADQNGFGAAAFVFSSANVGSPAGSALGALTWSAVGAGTVVADTNGTAAATLSFVASSAGQMAGQGLALFTPTFGAFGSGGPAGVAAAARTWSATATGVQAKEGTVGLLSAFSAAGSGGPAGSAASSLLFGVAATGQATGSDINGSSQVTLSWGATAAGSPAGSALAARTFTATVQSQPAVQGSATATFGFQAASSGVVGVGGQVLTPLVWSSSTAGSPAGSASVPFVWTTTAIGVPAVQGEAVASRTWQAQISGAVGGSAASSSTFLATAAGSGSTADANGQASASFAFGSTVQGVPAAQGAAGSPFTFQIGVVGQLAGTAAANFGFQATSTGVVGLSGAVVAAFGGAAAVTGTPTVVGVAVASRTWATSSQGGPAGGAVASFGWASVASGRIDVVGRAVGAFSFGAAATGDASGGGSLGVLRDNLHWHSRPEGHGPSDGVEEVRNLPVRADRHSILVPPRG